MRISFYGNNKKWGGLGNQGGSRTILLSAQTLREMGHIVEVVACNDRFTWFDHPKIKHEVSKDTDVIIAISISDAKEIMNQYPDKRLFYWARPFECDTEGQKWQMSEEKCMRTLFKLHRKGGIIMVNSGWQHNWLNMHKINNHLVYSGQDIEREMLKPDFYETNSILKPKVNLVIGCQYSSKPRKGWKEFKKIVEILGDKYDYVAFGSEKCKDKFLSTYLRNPPREKLNEFYQQMDVFVCSSSLEGFYNPGVEASVNGCLLLCNNNTRNGCSDYATRETSHIYNSQYLNCNEILNIFDHLDFAKVEKCQKLIQEKIGTRSKNMKKMVRVLK